MSSALAIATVTATVRQLLLDALTAATFGTATSIRPDKLKDQTAPTVNIYLDQVTPNSGWRNQDLPTRRPDGSVVGRCRTALDLHYVLTAFPHTVDYGAEKLLGYIVQTFTTKPALDRGQIKKVMDASSMKSSTLNTQVEQIKLSLHPLSLDELSKFFGMFPETPHMLSIALVATTVIIEADEEPEAPPPVRRFSGTVMPSFEPVLGLVHSSTGLSDPILQGGLVTLEGQNLGSTTVKALIDGAAPVTPTTKSNEKLEIALPNNLTAGIHSVQATYELTMGDPPGTRIFESGALPFALRPVLQSAAVAGAPAVLTVKVDLGVAKAQTVYALLNKSGSNDPAIRVELPARAGAAAIKTLNFPVDSVTTGKYVVRIRVDNAEGVFFDANKVPALGPEVDIP